MQTAATKAYLESKVLTATTEQLQLMLYDAAVRFAQQCAAAVAERDFERGQVAYERCDAVLCELHRGLRPEIMPELAENFASLYNFCQRQLDEGNMRHESKPIGDAVAVLKHLRQTWIMVMDQLAKEDSAEHTHAPSEEPALAAEM